MLRTFRNLLLVTSLLLIPNSVTAGSFLRAPEPVKDRYIVTFHDTVVDRAQVPAAAAEMVSRARGRLLASYRNGVRGFALNATERDVRALLHDPRVKTIEEAAVVHLSSGSDSFSVGQYWHLDRIDQRSLPLSGTYTWTYDGTGVDVYVVDTGIQSHHSEFLTGQVTAGANFAGNDIDSPPTQFAPTNPCGSYTTQFNGVNHYNGGHGTAVASLIGGQTTGVAKGATLIPVKFIPCDPSDPSINVDPDTVGVMWALDWIYGQVTDGRPVIRPDARRAVVNMSFFYETSERCIDQNGIYHDCVPALENNVNNLLNINVVVVASANNQNADRCTVQSPARMGYGGMYTDTNNPSQRLVITAGGTQMNDQRYLLNANGSNVGACVSIYAPAQMVHAAHIPDATAFRDDSAWYVWPWSSFETFEFWNSGTSFSAPIVSGVAARLLQKYPSMSVRDVWDYINASATALPTNFDGDNIPANDLLIYVSPSD